MHYVELRSLTNQCVRLGTFFSLTALDASGAMVASGRDEYHLDLAFSPHERMSALGRICIIQFDAKSLGIPELGILPAVPCRHKVDFIKIRTNHVTSLDSLARSLYLLLEHDEKSLNIELGTYLNRTTSLRAGEFLVDLTSL